MKILPLTLLAMAAAAQAQSPTATDAPAPVGHVTGSISCRDTGRPARFASIQLLPEKGQDTPLFDPSTSGTKPDQAKIAAQFASTLKSVLKGVLGGSQLATLTGLDGKFQLDQIPPGTYYVIAQLQGYRSPLSTLSQQERLAPKADVLATIFSQTQKIVVQPGQTIKLPIVLDRGATLSGTVTYSDGSPAQSVAPELLWRTKDGNWKQLATSLPLPMMTDDRGGFRFDGLPPGQYAVKAALPTEQAITGVGLGQLSIHLGTGDALVVYSGAALREADIKPIELTGDDNRSDINIIFPLDGLHTISGHVVAAQDQHPVNTGVVELQYPDNPSSLRTVIIGRDGSFQLRYVPAGAYVLKVTRAADMQSGTDGLPCPIGCKQINAYASTAMPVTVNADLLGVLLQVQ